MKTVSNKLFSLLLAVILLVAAVPFQVFAADDCTVNVDVMLNGMTLTSFVLDDTAQKDDVIDLTTDSRLSGPVNSKISGGADGFEIVSVVHSGMTLEPTAVKVEGNMSLKVTIKLINPKTFKMLLSANGGRYEGADNMDITYTFGQPMSKPNGSLASPDGFNFMGWSEDYVYPGDDHTGAKIFDFSRLFTYTTADSNGYALKLYGVWQEKLGEITINSVTGTSVSQVKKLTNLKRHTSVLDNLKPYKDTVQSAVPGGYAWNGLYYTDKACTVEVPQSATVGHSYTVYVKFAPTKYTVTFDPNGGSMGTHKTSKEVEYGQSFTIATPTQKGKLFVGWKDVNGEIYKPGSDGKTHITYKIPGNSTYTAVWNDQARVLLKIYINGKTSSSDMILDVTNKTTGSTFTLSEAKNLVRAKYVPTSGSKVQVLGLFDEEGWDGYVLHKDTSGALASIDITSTTDITEIYVMATNARLANGGTTNPTTPSDPSNPKTGDEAMLGTAAVIMMLAAASMAVVVIMRKKRIFF